MALIGYARVSTEDQTSLPQADELHAAVHPADRFVALFPRDFAPDHRHLTRMTLGHLRIVFGEDKCLGIF